MNLHLSLTPLISLVAGIMILVMPKLLNLIVAVYLIAIGVIGLVGTKALHLSRSSWQDGRPDSCFDPSRTFQMCRPFLSLAH